MFECTDATWQNPPFIEFPGCGPPHLFCRDWHGLFSHVVLNDITGVQKREREALDVNSFVLCNPAILYILQ